VIDRVRYYLGTATVQEVGGVNQHCFHPFLDHGRKRYIDFGTAAGIKDFKVSSDRRSRSLQVRDNEFVKCIFRNSVSSGIDEHGKARGSRQQLVQEPEPL
jgi:hypothetical protein